MANSQPHLEHVLRLQGRPTDFVLGVLGGVTGNGAAADAGVRGAAQTTSSTSDSRPRATVGTPPMVEAAIDPNAIDQNRGDQNPGETDAQPDTAEILQRLEAGFQHVIDAVGEYEQRRQQMLREMQELAVELALAVAAKLSFEKIFPAQMALDGTAIEDGRTGDSPDNPSEQLATAQRLVSQLAASLDQPTACQVMLNESEYELLQQATELSAAAGLQVRPDPRLSAGEYRVEMHGEELFASLPLKIAEIRQTLLETLADAETERRNTEKPNRLLRRFPERRATG